MIGAGKKHHFSLKLVINFNKNPRNSPTIAWLEMDSGLSYLVVSRDGVMPLALSNLLLLNIDSASYSSILNSSNILSIASYAS